MGFDLEEICCNPPSSSSSTANIFCNDNYNNCSPCRCHSCCRKSFLNDHTYSILKRVCYKIIKGFNRQQCREKYTIFDGGNSINGRWSEKQRDVSEYKNACKESEAELRRKKDQSDKDNGKFGGKTDNTESDLSKKRKKKDEKVVESSKVENDKERVEKKKVNNARGKKDIDESEPSKQKKKPDKTRGKSEHSNNKLIDESPKIGKGKGDKSRKDKNHSSVLEQTVEKEKTEKKIKGKTSSKTNKKEMEILKEINLDPVLKKGKKRKNSNDLKEVEKKSIVKKSKNPKETKKSNRASKPSRSTVEESHKDTKKGKPETFGDRKHKIKTKANKSLGDDLIRSSKSMAQKPRNGKRARSVSRESRIRNDFKGSKIIQNERRSNLNDLYSRKPSRGDEVRACDILRVHLEERDLSKCVCCQPYSSSCCQRCVPVCCPLVC